MKQAIEEEFILDVLQNYTTYNFLLQAHQNCFSTTLITTSRVPRENSVHYVENHEYAITQKARIMIDHFMQEVKHRIHGQAKAMVVTSSIPNAIKYKEALDAYLKELNLHHIKRLSPFLAQKESQGY